MNFTAREILSLIGIIKTQLPAPMTAILIARQNHRRQTALSILQPAGIGENGAPTTNAFMKLYLNKGLPVQLQKMTAMNTKETQAIISARLLISDLSRRLIIGGSERLAANR